MGEFYPEILASRDFILRTIRTEEESFSRTLAAGLNRFDLVTRDCSHGATCARRRISNSTTPSACPAI